MVGPWRPITTISNPRARKLWSMMAYRATPPRTRMNSKTLWTAMSMPSSMIHLPISNTSSTSCLQMNELRLHLLPGPRFTTAELLRIRPSLLIRVNHQSTDTPARPRLSTISTEFVKIRRKRVCPSRRRLRALLVRTEVRQLRVARGGGTRSSAAARTRATVQARSSLSSGRLRLALHRASGRSAGRRSAVARSSSSMLRVNVISWASSLSRSSPRRTCLD